VDDDMPGSWAIQDGRVTITSQDGTAVVLALIDGELCGEMQDGTTMIFSKEQTEAAATTPGLSPHFPSDKITLPEESAVVRVFEGVPNEYSGGDYIEITEITLPLPKTEAIAYFSALLTRGDEEFFNTNDFPFPPDAITDAYPDVTSDFQVSASYYHSRGVHGITVHLFVKDEEEKVYAAYIEVTYAKDPSAPVIAPTELSIASLRQEFADMNYWTSEDIPFMIVGDLEPVDGFEMNFAPKDGGAWINIRFTEFKDDADLQRYIGYREDYPAFTSFGLIYVEFSEDTEEVRSFIEDTVNYAGG
jgi:hypothetical protein